MAAWADIPSVVLLEIFKYLSRADRYTCSIVCKPWHRATMDPQVWKDMVVSLDTDMVGMS